MGTGYRRGIRVDTTSTHFSIIFTSMIWERSQIGQTVALGAQRVGCSQVFSAPRKRFGGGWGRLLPGLTVTKFWGAGSPRARSVR